MYVIFLVYGCLFFICLSLFMFVKKEIFNFFIEMFYLKLLFFYYNKRIIRVVKIKKKIRKYSIL